MEDEREESTRGKKRKKKKDRATDGEEDHKNKGNTGQRMGMTEAVVNTNTADINNTITKESSRHLVQVVITEMSSLCSIISLL